MIRQHPARGLWEARYTAAGGRRRSLYAKTRKEAQEPLRAALSAADNGIAPADTRTTVEAYLASWLETTVAVKVRPRTVTRYRDTVRRYTSPASGAFRWRN
jgi:hypothetical protein